MKRLAIMCSAVAMVLAIAPAAAFAGHHHARHHSRVHHSRKHHSRTHTVRIKRFGTDAGTAAPTTPSSTTAPTTPASSAGTVQSFQNGVLTILLTGGSTVSGTVNNNTEIECMAAEESSGMHQDGDGGSGRGDNGGSGSGDNGGGGDNGSQTTSGQSSGDDHGDTAEPADTQGNDPAENENENENENEAANNNCSSANLIPGATVREAELRISSGGSVWSKVELGS